MRRHGWELPYHPLQVVAVAVFLALGFAFYVFFAPFVGKRVYQYIVIGLYTPLVICVFGLYIWSTALDPADPGVLRSKKYQKANEVPKHSHPKCSKECCQSASMMRNGNGGAACVKSLDKHTLHAETRVQDQKNDVKGKISSSEKRCLLKLILSACACLCKCVGGGEESPEQQMSEEGMFYCSLCEVEVFRYSKHCRVCDKCVDQFDHHCRWVNNCIGKKNYSKFFVLMVCSILLLILQWSTGILVLVFCFLDRKRFSTDISSKLGSSFSLVPFVAVVAICTLLALLATLPVAQLFFFHILLIKKGITTYDYIVALREQEQEHEAGGAGQQSPQCSTVSSITGFSSASSFNTFQRSAWCTPPRLFLEDQFDVVPPDTGPVSSYGKKMAVEVPVQKKNPQVKINPWMLARLNPEDVSKAAAEARKRSKILRPIMKGDQPSGFEASSSLGSSSGTRRMNPRRPANRMNISGQCPEETSVGFALGPLQLEARSAFQTNQAMSVPVFGSSPESAWDSPEIHPVRVSSPGPEESKHLSGMPFNSFTGDNGIIPLSRSTSDGYEASGGEDSDQVPPRSVYRSVNRGSLRYGVTDRERRIARQKLPLV